MLELLSENMLLRKLENVSILYFYVKKVDEENDQKNKKIMKKIMSLLFICLLTLTLIPPIPAAAATTPYAANGRLSISNGKVVNSKGKPFVIKGVSTHGLAWYPEYVNEKAFQTLRDNFGVNTIRLALYTAEYNGYCTGGNKANLEKIIDNGVKYAKNLGMYVIIDWHILSDGNHYCRNPNLVSGY